MLTPLSEKCKICSSQSALFDRGQILHRHAVQYYRCENCGFIQTESPYWLEEAYSSAISRLDTGILSRNLRNRDLTSSLLNLLFPNARRLLDFGAGHGIFVRLMRDSGFECFWQDLHATNDYARGFEHKAGQQYDLLTSFEVLEHLTDPLAGLSEMVSLSPNVFVSTELLPNPAPKISEWWYYLLASGQHISFFTHASLKIIADRFGRHLLSRGPYHLLSTNPQSRLRFRFSLGDSRSRVVNVIRRRPSLQQSDFQFLSSEALWPRS
jgi:hypothetical protein